MSKSHLRGRKRSHGSEIGCVEMATKVERKARQWASFVEKHPQCCFCGGATPTEEKEHLPSRACFDDRAYPDGFEFPTCRTCNASTSQDEQVVAMLSRSLSHPSAPASKAEVATYMAGTRNNSRPEFMEMSVGMTRLPSGDGILGIGDNIRAAMDRVLTRWAKAFHYMETGVIVPVGARIHAKWFTNAASQIPGEVFAGKERKLTRNGRDLGDQMMYVAMVSPDTDPGLGQYTVAFRRSFLAVIMVDVHGKIIP